MLLSPDSDSNTVSDSISVSISVYDNSLCSLPKSIFGKREPKPEQFVAKLTEHTNSQPATPTLTLRLHSSPVTPRLPQNRCPTSFTPLIETSNKCRFRYAGGVSEKSVTHLPMGLNLFEGNATSP